MATLATQIEETIIKRRNRWGNPSIDFSQGGNPTIVWDYATPVGASLIHRLWNVVTLAFNDDTNQYDNDIQTAVVNTKINKFGFRSSNSTTSSRQPFMSYHLCP
jgi:hypothetical protein